MKKLTYRSTMAACYNGYITQAIAINLAPLLYVTFLNTYGLTLSDISALIAVNFITQLALDFFASCFANRLNARAAEIFAHLAVVAGLLGLSFFPEVLPPFAGLCLSEALLGIGGGLTEVLISPMIEACPTEGKAGNMSLLHSFYSWGQTGIILLSSIFFWIFDVEEYWRILPVFWAIFPFLGAIAFCIVPVYTLNGKTDEGEKAKKSDLGLLKSPLFLSFILMMICGGASEMVMSQWASGFAESALGVSKSVGDICGPCLFALMMGIARLSYGKLCEKVRLETFMTACCVLCIGSYLLAVFSPWAPLAFVGCALCGFSVGVFWPGTLSHAAAHVPEGGMSMFAILAFAGDVGCLVAPSIAGKIADLAGGDLRAAFLFATVFPVINLILLLVRRVRDGGKTKSDGADG